MPNLFERRCKRILRKSQIGFQRATKIRDSTIADMDAVGARNLFPIRRDQRALAAAGSTPAIAIRSAR
jgi:hypothetical protein